VQDVWDLIVIGRGSAAAYYLSGLDREQFPNILVIGLDDPWSGERGYNQSSPQDPVNFINHTWQMLVHLCGEDLPEFSKDLVDRLKFAQANAQVIDQFATKIVPGSVSAVREFAVEGFSAYGRAIQVKVGTKW
jgi:hypothetical protein